MYKYFFYYKYNMYNRFSIFKSKYSTKSNEFMNEIYDANLNNISKIGHIRHNPPVIRTWSNSVYNFNKNNQDDTLAKYNKLTKIIKSYFNLHNNIKLARSKRMRYLRIKSIAKKLYVSKPEVKQTNDKIIITVYYFDKLKHSFTRKNFFFNRPNIIKLLLNKKYGKKQYGKRVLIKKTKFLERRIKYLGIKQIKELKKFNNINKFKNKYLEQSLCLYFFKYLLSMVNIQIYNPIYLSNKLINKNNKHKYMKLIIIKEGLNIDKIINSNPNTLFWINFNNFSFEKIHKDNINYNYLISKVIYEHKYLIKNITRRINHLTKLNFISQINKKLFIIINYFVINNILSKSLVLKIYNFLSLKVYKNITKKMFKRQYNKVYKLTYLSMSNIIKFKSLLPSLKMLIDTFYNKKTELNMVNLKYFFLNADIFTQVLITKLKKKVSPTRIIKKSLGKAKVFLNHNFRKQVVLNNMDKLSEYANLSLYSFPVSTLYDNTKPESVDSKDWLQTIFDRLFPHNLLQKYKKSNDKLRKKVSNILNNIKYKGILGIRVEAKGRLTRRHKAARSIMHLYYKGNLKDNDFFYNKEENFERSKPTVLLRNDTRANTQFISKSSIRRIGSFGIKTWISGK